MAFADVRAREHHLGAQRAQMEDLLPRHLVGYDENQLVALLRRHQRQPQPGVAGGGLDDGAAGLEPAVARRGFDHRQPDSILDRAGRILVLELHEQPARAGVEAGDLEHRRVADQFQEAFGGHRCILAGETRRKEPAFRGSPERAPVYRGGAGPSPHVRSERRSVVERDEQDGVRERAAGQLNPVLCFGLEPECHALVQLVAARPACRTCST